MFRMLLVGCSCALACGPSSPAGPGEQDSTEGPDARPSSWPDARSESEFSDARPTEVCNAVDLLFVIDNSGSMAQEQANLAANFPAFIGVLENFGGGVDYRVAVTTTGRDYTWRNPVLQVPDSTEGDSGAMLQRCDMTRRWVEPGDPSPSSTFSCAAQVGDDGPTKEMPLGSMKDAFSARMADGTNAGFRRDDALLAIVVLTDEDDCSYESSITLGIGESLCDSPQREPVTTYKAFLDTYTGNAGRWALAAIAGETDCSSAFGGAQEAVRLKELVGLAGDNGVFSSICDADLSNALAEALETFDTACQNFPPIE